MEEAFEQKMTSPGYDSLSELTCDKHQGHLAQVATGCAPLGAAMDLDIVIDA
jgi:hypothetical protein